MPSPLCRVPAVSLWLVPSALLAIACGGETTDPGLLGDLSFRITQYCDGDGACEPPECENVDCTTCDDGTPPTAGGCWITGIGFLVDSGGKDNFGGNGMPMKAGYIRGEWEHQDHATGDKLHGRIRYLSCRQVDEPGPGVPNGPNHDFKINQAYYGGAGRWYTPATGWQEGYWFDVMAEDHGEPGKTDEYYFNVRTMDAAGNVGPVIYSTGGVLGGGNFQIHPPNTGHPFTLGTLPAWVPLQP
jgi:hypothetical protein